MQYHVAEAYDATYHIHLHLVNSVTLCLLVSSAEFLLKSLDPDLDR